MSCEFNLNGKKKRQVQCLLSRCGCVFPTTKKQVLVCTYLEDKVDVAEVPSLGLEARVIPQKYTLKVPSPGMLPAHN